MNISETYTYCKRLKELRTSKGWSLQQAAIKYGVTKSKLNSYETVPETHSNGVKNAGREAPIDFLLKACEIYGVTLDYLCGRSETVAPTHEEAEIIEKYGLTVEALKILRELQNAKIKNFGIDDEDDDLFECFDYNVHCTFCKLSEICDEGDVGCPAKDVLKTINTLLSIDGSDVTLALLDVLFKENEMFLQQERAFYYESGFPITEDVIRTALERGQRINEMFLVEEINKLRKLVHKGGIR